VNAQLTPQDSDGGRPADEQNGLGTASFVCSIVGLFSAGILSVVGLILGAIAMRREPKGLAIAGFVIGLIGTFFGCLLAALFFAMISAAGMGLSTGILSMIYSQITVGVTQIDDASEIIVKWEQSHNGDLPTTEAGNAALKAAGFGATYRVIDNDEFELKLVIGAEDPWTFSAEFDADGERTSLRWKSESGQSHGNWNF
jgi:hypothetical protein